MVPLVKSMWLSLSKCARFFCFSFFFMFAILN